MWQFRDSKALAQRKRRYLLSGRELEGAAKAGKGRGSGTRTIYPCELPHCMAKSRSLADTIPLQKFDRSLWTQLFGKEA